MDFPHPGPSVRWQQAACLGSLAPGGRIIDCGLGRKRRKSISRQATRPTFEATMQNG